MSSKTKYYLVHGVVDPKPEKILKILKDGYLYASSYTKQYGLFYGETLDYVYLSLLGDENVSVAYGGVSFILDISILYEKSFRYALKWVGNEIEKSIEVNHKYDDVDKILDIINEHIITIDKKNIGQKLSSHEILIKKINLHKYLAAICCKSNLTKEIIGYVEKNYPNVVLIEKFPDSANEVSKLLLKDKKRNHLKHKYLKYKTKYIQLKKMYTHNNI